MKKINVRVTDDKPYIFVSYAHADDEEVYPIIEELDRRGYRVWYDEGITPGKVWADVIGKHVMECQIMLLFISENYIKSENCEDEWSFAKSENKNFVCVMLHPTHLPAGMKMQMQKRQMVLKYEEQEKDAFFGKLCSAPGMELCLREPELPEMAEPVQTVKEEVKVKKKKAQRKLLSGDWIKKGIAVVLGVLLLVVTLALASGGGQKSGAGNPSGGVDSQNWNQVTDPLLGEHVKLSDMTVTADMIGTLSENKNLQDLYFENCSFESGVLSQLSSTTVVELRMGSCTGVDDLSCLNQMPNLNTLELRESALKDGCIPVVALPELYTVDVSFNPELSDLSWLSGADGLETISFHGTNISDLSPLASLPKLVDLSAENCPITDITPLQTAGKLEILFLNGCPVEDPEVTFTCLRLKELYLSGSKMTSLQPFENCTILQKVNIAESTIQDISILQKSAKTLKRLYLYESGLDREDLRFMEDCTALEVVQMDGIPMEDLSILQNAQELQLLTATSCGLKDISALAGKSELSFLALADNQIQDISALSGWYHPDYATLDLGYNPLTDASALPVSNSYLFLDLRCKELDLTTIPGLSCGSISVYYSDAIYDSSLANKDKIHTYYIYDCPPDRQVALEDYFGYQLELHTSDEVSE